MKFRIIKRKQKYVSNGDRNKVIRTFESIGKAINSIAEWIK